MNKVPESNERFEELVAKFRQRKYRMTPQRIALLRLIASSGGHPSAAILFDKIKEQFPTTSPATVYKTLSVLKEMGEVLELGFSNDDNRYDGNRPYPHPHLICLSCRKIIDPDVNSIDNIELTIADRTGYQIVNYRMDFYGICPECQEHD